MRDAKGKKFMWAFFQGLLTVTLNGLSDRGNTVLVDSVLCEASQILYFVTLSSESDLWDNITYSHHPCFVL